MLAFPCSSREYAATPMSSTLALAARAANSTELFRFFFSLVFTAASPPLPSSSDSSRSMPRSTAAAAAANRPDAAAIAGAARRSGSFLPSSSRGMVAGM